MGNILIGYLSDKFLQQVTNASHDVCVNFSDLQDGGRSYEHPRAPALFLISIVLTIVLRLLNSTVGPRVSDVSTNLNKECKQTSEDIGILKLSLF